MMRSSRKSGTPVCSNRTLYVYAVATALVKGRILQVQLDGLGAVEKKDQVIGLLKSAASRL